MTTKLDISKFWMKEAMTKHCESSHLFVYSLIATLKIPVRELPVRSAQKKTLNPYSM